MTPPLPNTTPPRTIQLPVQCPCAEPLRTAAHTARSNVHTPGWPKNLPYVFAAAPRDPQETLNKTTKETTHDTTPPLVITHRHHHKHEKLVSFFFSTQTKRHRMYAYLGEN